MALWTMKAVEDMTAMIRVAMSQLSFSGSPNEESSLFQTVPLKRLPLKIFVLRKIMSTAGSYLSHCTGMS